MQPSATECNGVQRSATECNGVQPEIVSTWHISVSDMTTSSTWLQRTSLSLLHLHVQLRFTSENDQDVACIIFRSTHLYARKLIVMDDNMPGSSKKLFGYFSSKWWKTFCVRSGEVQVMIVLTYSLLLFFLFPFPLSLLLPLPSFVNKLSNNTYVIHILEDLRKQTSNAWHVTCSWQVYKEAFSW